MRLARIAIAAIAMAIAGCAELGSIQALSGLDTGTMTIVGQVPGLATGTTVRAIDLATGEVRATAPLDGQGTYRMSVRTSGNSAPWIVEAVPASGDALAAPVFVAPGETTRDLAPADAVLTFSLASLAADGVPEEIEALSPGNRVAMATLLAALGPQGYASASAALAGALATATGEVPLATQEAALTLALHQKAFAAAGEYSPVASWIGLPAAIAPPLCAAVESAASLPGETMALAIPRGEVTLFGWVAATRAAALAEPQTAGTGTVTLAVSLADLATGSADLTSLVGSLQVTLTGLPPAAPVLATIPVAELPYDAATGVVSLVLPDVPANPLQATVVALDPQGDAFSSATATGSLTPQATLSLAVGLALPSTGLSVNLGAYPAPTVTP